MRLYAVTANPPVKIWGRARPARLLRYVLGMLGAIALLLVLAGGWAAWLQATGNFHAVIPGEIYRSAQPDAAEMKEWLTDHQIRSVLNLRGASGAAWYRTEQETAAKLNVVHADFAMRESQVLTEAQAQELLALLDRLPKPILIHCKAGADRSGLAAALYLAAHGHSVAEAGRQISFRYGHVSLPFSAAWPMDLSWQSLKQALD